MMSMIVFFVMSAMACLMLAINASSLTEEPKSIKYWFFLFWWFFIGIANSLIFIFSLSRLK